MKKKILAWCDFVAPTGFANVAKNLLNDIHQEFDISIVGINYFGDRKYDTDKYFVYSVTQDDMIGIKRLVTIAQRDQPDLIFLFQDIFHISDHIDRIKQVSPKSKIVVYFPVDGAPFSIGWKNVLDKADIIITYSDWAIKVIRETFPDFKKPIHKLYHGVDITTFFPFTPEKILEARKNNGWENKFTVINVNRFQPRKAIPLSLRAFSMFAKGYKVCSCGNEYPIHLKTCDLNGCSEKEVIKVMNNPKEDVFLYLHMMKQEWSMGPGRTNLLQSHLLAAGFTDKDYNKIIGINDKSIYNQDVPESKLNELYNGANLNMTTTMGEGCGLSLLESAATGTPSIAPNNSAVAEQLNGTGILIKNITTFSHPNDNAYVRPIVDVRALRDGLKTAYNTWKAAKVQKTVYQACVDNIKTNFMWDDKRELLAGWFKEALRGS
jgi:glycosyltransferase involved in cell wall biosynthesis